MDEATRYWVVGHRIRPIETIGDFGLVEITSLPGVPGPPPHHHDEAAEFFYIADGRLDVMVGDAWRTLEAGESLTIPKGVVHTLRNNGERDCRWITGWSPRGFERFFTELGVPDRGEGSFEASVSEEAIGRVVEECARYGMILAPGVGR